MQRSLRLDIPKYVNDSCWQWVLSDHTGIVLGSYDVRLDQSAFEYAGYQDLPHYLEMYSGAFSQTELIKRVSKWMGDSIFGHLRDAIGEELVRSPLLPISICLPPQGLGLAQRPLGVARLKETTFVESGVRFVYQQEDDPLPKTKSIGKEIHVLAVFSLPTNTSPLNLRKERYELVRLLQSIKRRLCVCIDVRIVQYGATRRTLEHILDEGDGWDIIHFSGHGAAGFLVLENESGSEDIIEAHKLAEMLRVSRERLKLITLSACMSGATLQQARQWLDPSRPRVPAEMSSSPQIISLGQRLAHELDVAVAAMRFTVSDQFAIGLSRHLYPLLFEKRQVLPRALHTACIRAITPDVAEHAPLSFVTPVLFGPRSLDLMIVAPPECKPKAISISKTGLFGFPPEPDKFVGRVLPMLRASQAFAPQSGKVGVVFYGMAGAGKTTCAVELSYRHERDRFRGYVYKKCPEEAKFHPEVMMDFLRAMEDQLLMESGTLIALAGCPEDYQRRLLPRIKDLLAREAILIVLDNIDGLITESGKWIDDRWQSLVDVMLSHGGDSRLVITSRRMPEALRNDPRVCAEVIHALSFAESLLLAREMQNLSKFFDNNEDRRLLSRILLVVQGHPKLLEMADALAVSREQLEQQVEKSMPEEKIADPSLNVFFNYGESRQEDTHFLESLISWTKGTVAMLPTRTQTLFAFLCRLEDDHRHELVLRTVWPVFLKKIEHLDMAVSKFVIEDSSDLYSELDNLASSGLVQISKREVETVEGENLAFVFCEIHPGIVDAELTVADLELLKIANELVGEYFLSCIEEGSKSSKGERLGIVVVEAARAAMPYLLRGKHWKTASWCLQEVVLRDRTPATRHWAISIARHLLTHLSGSDYEASVLSMNK